MPGFVRIVDDADAGVPRLRRQRHVQEPGQHPGQPEGRPAVHRLRAARTGCGSAARPASSSDDPLLAEFPGAQSIVRVHAERIFPNCPRYIHRMELVEHSVYAPRPGHEPPEPDWKRMDVFRDALPRKSAGESA